MDRLSMYVLSDIHYLSHKMWTEGESIDAREKGDQIAIKCTPEILDTFIDLILEDKQTDNVLITGDLINNGDLQSHLDFRDAAETLKKAGKKVYIICSTHDYAGEGRDENIFNAVYYTKTGCEKAESVYKTDLPELYKEFGPSSADSVHEQSGSYSVLMQQGYRLIAVNDIGNGRSHCGLFPDGVRWLTEELKKAKEKGEYVIFTVHHPVLPPFPLYPAVVEFEMYGGYKQLRELLCEYNVKVIFTGHTHVQGIKKYEDGKGRSFYDITTSALPAPRGRMRKVIFDRDEGTCTVSSIGIKKIKGFDTGNLSSEEYIDSLNFAGLFERALRYRKTDWEKFAKEASHIFGEKLFCEHRLAAKAGFSFFDNCRMSFFSRIGGRYCNLTKEEKQLLKNEYLKTVIFVILRHVFSGNAPYTPDTPEYKAFTGFTKRIDSLLNLIKFDISEKLPDIHSVTEIILPFLYNVRTGDDDSIIINLEN